MTARFVAQTSQLYEVLMSPYVRNHAVANVYRFSNLLRHCVRLGERSTAGPWSHSSLKKTAVSGSDGRRFTIPLQISVTFQVAEAPISCDCPTGVELNWCSESCLTTYVHNPEMMFFLGISLSQNLMVMSSDVQPQISIQGCGCKMLTSNETTNFWEKRTPWKDWTVFHIPSSYVHIILYMYNIVHIYMIA